MKKGDFTSLAKNYHNRPGYSVSVLTTIAKLVQAHCGETVNVADVGAGTGKLTENLVECGFECIAVEPNDAMRAEGKKYTANYPVKWQKGSGEETGLESGSADWLLMGSAFHWVDPSKGLPEFHRVLKKGGFFTAIWNPRDLERSDLHSRIETRIYEIVPELSRVSSGGKKYTETMSDTIVSTGQFSEPLFIETRHEIQMEKERYLGAWRSVNDIQSQAGPERFEAIMSAIEEEIAHLDTVPVPYKTRSWTAQRID